jgi:hypothetical protein
MSWIEEYNQRQYKQMLRSISLYEMGHESAGGLFNSLLLLSNCLEQVEQTWKNQLIQHAGILEEVYAYIRIEQREMTDDEKRLINNAIANLKGYITPLIEIIDTEVK